MQASRQRNSFKEIKRSKSEGSMMKRSPTLMRIRRGSRKGRGHSRPGSAGGFLVYTLLPCFWAAPGVEAGQEEGQRKPRRASSWSPIQLGDGEEGGRHSLGELLFKSRSVFALAFGLKQTFHLICHLCTWLL